MRVISRRDDGGAIAIVVAAMAVVMFGFAALVVDLGLVRGARAEGQAAADASALGGAGELYASGSADLAAAVAEAINLAERNYGTPPGDWFDASCTATVPPTWVMAPPPDNTPCVVFDNATEPIEIQVVLPVREVGSAFGGLMDYSGMDVTAYATAQAFKQPIQNCSLCVQGFLRADGVVSVTGDGSVIADDGSVGASGLISVATPGQIAFRLTPNPVNSPTRYSPNPPVRATPVDPFAGAAMPPLIGTISATNTTCNGPGDLLTTQPYRNVVVSGNCPLPIGTVVITGNLTFANTSPAPAMTGSSSGSTVFFGCRDGVLAVPCNQSGVDGRGRLNMTRGTLTIPLSSFSGFAVLADPDNTQPMTISGLLDVTGGVYARRSSVRVGGTTGRLDVVGLASVAAIRVDGGRRVDLLASGLGSSPGPPDLALTE